MKKLFINQKGEVILKEVKIPVIGKIGSIVKNKYALISTGTELVPIKQLKYRNQHIIKKVLKSKELRKKILKDLKGFKIVSLYRLLHLKLKRQINTKNFFSPKSLRPLGYSCSGIIQETNVGKYHIGDRVACAGSNHAEIISSTKNLTCKIPDNISFEEAAFVAIGAIALHAIHRADIQLGEFVGIIGTGLIGLIVVQLAKLKGAYVVGFDLNEERLKIASQLGADRVINAKYNLNEFIINNITNGFGFDSIIICTASDSPKPLIDAVNFIREKGKIVILGAVSINLDQKTLYNKEADLLISRSYGPGRYDPMYEFEGYDYPKNLIEYTARRNMKLFLQLLSKKEINVKSLITDIFSVKKANLAYKKLETKPNSSIAVLLDFTNNEIEVKTRKEKLELSKPQKKLSIGLIGCGTFAQKYHLPHLLLNKNCNIKGICTKSKNSAKICKEKYFPDYVTTDYRKILKDPDIDTVFIYTRHDTHAKFTIEAIKANKNVYCEKPMGITLEECFNVYNTVKSAQKNYTIGFNRRYSPLIKIAKDLLKKRENPIIINYRIASSFLSGNHWGFNPKVGGGPIIGEFCHFTDLVLYLMNSKPIELIARGGSLSHKNLDLYESCVVIIKFENKSIANLIYTDLSGPRMPKERIEIFSGDSSIIIDDFITFKTSGFDSGNIKLNQQDKGHKNELKNVIKTNLGLEKPLIKVENAIRAMDLAFKTIESIKKNEIIKIGSELYA